jgi:hypothetical protein
MAARAKAKTRQPKAIRAAGKPAKELASATMGEAALLLLLLPPDWPWRTPGNGSCMSEACTPKRPDTAYLIPLAACLLVRVLENDNNAEVKNANDASDYNTTNLWTFSSP